MGPLLSSCKCFSDSPLWTSGHNNLSEVTEEDEKDSGNRAEAKSESESSACLFW